MFSVQILTMYFRSAHGTGWQNIFNQLGESSIFSPLPDRVLVEYLLQFQIAGFCQAYLTDMLNIGINNG